MRIVYDFISHSNIGHSICMVQNKFTLFLYTQIVCLLYVPNDFWALFLEKVCTHLLCVSLKKIICVLL